ncbi:MAG TPA: exodeoxyribonuclease V subunit gamma, partial [Polyangiales bacterium]|nr:exodeoxyribonuclease V subunit gamma [Polyangiales bacterium]
HYLEGDDHARLRVALAGRLADLFDQYATYRPELVLDWQRGREAHFQALLFRAYAEQHGAGHVAARAEQFLHALRNDPEARKRLPERVTVFGISTLPPLYLDLLGALSQHIDVSLFLLSPTREYYADLRSRAQLDAAHLSDAELDALHLEPGHPLLASLGRHGRELSEVLEERTQYMEVPDDLYEEPGEDTLLHRLQSDMLALRDRGHAPDAPRLPIAPGDDSLAIHACHGAMREVEVLHDQLVALLSQQGIEPHDVIVMTPDIEAYAPVIDAVFAENPGRARIPFRIADRGALRSFEVVTALDAILDTLGGRMGVNQVLDLLGMEVIRARFAITADEVETARSLCAQSGVRWGIDASHRHEVEQPEREENTWRFGLARLALGYALPADGDALCLDRAPCAIDSAQGELFGKLSELCETLFALHTELREPCSLPEWQARITRVLGALISEDASTADERKLCQRAMQNLVEHAARAGFAEPIGLATLRAELGDALDERSPAQAFLAGGVTFCQLVPMRSIPFRAVCLLGMNDGAFPASDAPLGFDKIAEKPRKGDRSRRNDDRQLFLEAILSARDKLLITYAGQSIHDGKPLPPSVLVSELIDHVARGFVLPGEPAGGLLEHTRRVEARLVVRHALAAFSPRYFGAEQDPRFFSFARGQYGGAKALLAPRTQAPAFFTRRTASEPTPVREIALADLESFV